MAYKTTCKRYTTYMKRILLLTVILISLKSNSQGYGSVGSAALIKNGSNHSLTLGAGYQIKNFSAGILADFYGVGKSSVNQFVLPALDLRYFVKKAFISLQPGWIGYNKTQHNINTKGSFAGAAVLGYRYKFAELTAGYQYTSFKTMNVLAKSHQVKVALLFSLRDE